MVERITKANAKKIKALEELRKWREDESVDVLESLHEYFQDAKYFDTYDVAEEASWLWPLLFEDEGMQIQPYSPMNDFFHVICRVSGEAYLRSVAHLLNIKDFKAFDMHVWQHAEDLTNGDVPPTPITFKELEKIVKENRRFLNTFKRKPKKKIVKP